MTVPLVADAYGWDRAFAAMFLGAKCGETSSQMFALRARQGHRASCRMCSFLSWAVEKDHCELSLTVGDGATSGAAADRAGIALLALFLACLAAVGAPAFLAGLWLSGRWL